VTHKGTKDRVFIGGLWGNWYVVQSIIKENSATRFGRFSWGGA